jgi:hypothetical protein
MGVGMKKLIFAMSIPALAIGMLGADIRRNESANFAGPVPTKKKCVGYTIVEFGKGIDCNGDTLKLVRINGVQVPSRQ